MIQILNVSAECYPAAKTGGLADVVGSLPKYFTAAGMLSASVIPKYSLKWIHKQEWVIVYGGSIKVDWRHRDFTVQQLANDSLGYPLFVVDIPGLFDRAGVYNDPSGASYGDEVERYVVFQQAVLQWLLSFPWHDRPRVLHCHDHHTGLIPWMIKYCPAYQELAPIPTVFTIHNGQYQGAFSFRNLPILPAFEPWARALLDWNGAINPMATAIKCAWAVTTVSQSYLYELHESSLGLEPLLKQEWRKEWGIINGIDADVWDPATDPMLQHRFEGDVDVFKMKNKKALCEWFGLPEDKPLISFIGRIVGEKGADLLPDAIKAYLHAGGKASFLVLGTGEKWVEQEFRSMAYYHPGTFNAIIDYNEALSHQIYAGSDFLIMPSRVEPCGLNQLYSMRYGTIPIVRSIGGLKDTVPDIGMADGTGRGIRFDHFNVDDAVHAIHRAASMWHNNRDIVAWLRKKIMAIDFSWEETIRIYQRVYNSIGAHVMAPSEVVPPTEKPEAEIILFKEEPRKKAPEKKADQVPANLASSKVPSAPAAKQTEKKAKKSVDAPPSSNASKEKTVKPAEKKADKTTAPPKPAEKKTKKTTPKK